METPDQGKSQVVYTDTAKAARVYGNTFEGAPARPGALEELENGLNRFVVELEQFEARINAVLESPVTSPSGPDLEDHLSAIDAQTARLHALVGQLAAIRERVRL